MLKRKMLFLFGSLVVLLAGMSASAIWLLRGVLRELHHISTEAVSLVDKTSQLGNSIRAIEVELYQLQLGKTRHLNALIREMERMENLTSSIGRTSYVVRSPTAAPHYQRLSDRLPVFRHRVSSLATAQDPVLARQWNIEALEDAIALRQDVQQIDEVARLHARDEENALIRRFRWVVLGLVIGCLLTVHLAVMTIVKSFAMVLRPVEKLVTACRELSQERFDCRIEIGQKDEFHELAEAYNNLAERLQTSEQQKMEMLKQVALTLNHELNNAMATIALQLQILGRWANGDAAQETCLRRIQQNLARMVETVESLKRVRQVVLTDYVSGVKMLDLYRSVQSVPSNETAE